MNDAISSLAFAWGGHAGNGNIRVQPADFSVRESLGFTADGEGEHLLVSVRKTNANTHWVARELAKFGRVALRDVGFSGLKDRYAVTEQSFTLPGRGQSLDAWRSLKGDGFEVIGADLHRRKLRRGAHRYNEFEIFVRELNADRTGLESTLQRIAMCGVPNYFGVQRFGRGGANLQAAHQWFDQGRPPADRLQRGFALSAARAAIFNAVLSSRVAHGTWAQLSLDDVPNLDGTNSIFTLDTLDRALIERCERLDIHPSGPLWGKGELRSTGAVRELELATAAQFDSFAAGLAAQGLEQERRALRLRVQNLRWEFQADGLKLFFRLSRGAFATTVLRELIDAKSAAGGDEVEAEE